MIPALTTEVIIMGAINLAALAAGYGGLRANVRDLRRNVEKLDSAIHNGITTKLSQTQASVASLEATCKERARGVCSE